MRLKCIQSSAGRSFAHRFSSPSCLLAVSAFILPPQVHANSAQDSTLTLGTVSVSSARTGPLATSDVLSSVDILSGDVVEKMPVTYSWELFSRLPGVELTEFNQGTTSGKISFRGFNGEGEVNAVKLLIDGIPSNSNDGNMPFMDMVFPLDIDSIEMVRGTSDPRYGLNNIAGNVNINTRIGGDYSKARVRYGSFGTRETQLAKGVEAGNWTQNYFLAYQKSDGYRDHARQDRVSMAGKWFYTPDDQPYRLGLILRHYEGEAQEPGYLTGNDAHDHSTMSNRYNASDNGTRRMNSASLHFDADLAERLSLSAKTYINTFDDRRWTRYWSTSTQQERDAYETQYGAISSLTWRPHVDWLHALALEGGLDMQRQQNISERYSTAQRVRVTQTRDQHFDFNTVGSYIQAVIEPTDTLKIIPAYRVDKLSGDFTNEMTSLSNGMNDYGLIKQPKLSIAYSPWSWASLYANWGRTFQVGTGSSSYKIPSQTSDLAPSINEGWETGVKFTPANWIDGRVAYWQQEASGEVSRRLNDPTGASDNVGQTRRWGYDLQVNLHPSDRTEIWMAYAWQYSKILKPGATYPDSQGNEIDHVPNHLYNAGASYQVTPALQITGWVNGQSDSYLEKNNIEGTYGGYVLFNLGASWKLSEHLSMDMQLKNLANRYYEYVWYDPDGAMAPLHSPGDGRAFYTGISLDF